jgi:hypothetical protein
VEATQFVGLIQACLIEFQFGPCKAVTVEVCLFDYLTAALDSCTVPPVSLLCLSKHARHLSLRARLQDLAFKSSEFGHHLIGIRGQRMMALISKPNLTVGSYSR